VIIRWIREIWFQLFPCGGPNNGVSPRFFPMVNRVFTRLFLKFTKGAAAVKREILKFTKGTGSGTWSADDFP
jgi:hypothetical protein